VVNERAIYEMGVVAANALVRTASYRETGNKRKHFRMHGEIYYEAL
jgi:hypothetical protein